MEELEGYEQVKIERLVRAGEKFGDFNNWYSKETYDKAMEKWLTDEDPCARTLSTLLMEDTAPDSERIVILSSPEHSIGYIIDWDDTHITVNLKPDSLLPMNLIMIKNMIKKNILRVVAGGVASVHLGSNEVDTFKVCYFTLTAKERKKEGN